MCVAYLGKVEDIERRLRITNNALPQRVYEARLAAAGGHGAGGLGMARADAALAGQGPGARGHVGRREGEAGADHQVWQEIQIPIKKYDRKKNICTEIKKFLKYK